MTLYCNDSTIRQRSLPPCSRQNDSECYKFFLQWQKRARAVSKLIQPSLYKTEHSKIDRHDVIIHEISVSYLEITARSNSHTHVPIKRERRIFSVDIQLHPTVSVGE